MLRSFLGTALRHWSMSIQAPGVYLMIKEQRVDVPVRFIAKDIELIPFIEFHKTVAVSGFGAISYKVDQT